MQDHHAGHLDVRIRQETRFDWQWIRKVNRAAFPTDAEANLVDALRESGHAACSLVAETSGQLIVGHILFSRSPIVTPSGIIESLSLAPMSVLPDYQRTGIGSQLVSHGLEECRRLGHKIVLVLGHPDFYPRFGFSAKLAEPIECPFGSGTSWMANELEPGSMANLQGSVRYASPFDQLC